MPSDPDRERRQAVQPALGRGAFRSRCCSDLPPGEQSLGTGWGGGGRSEAGGERSPGRATRVLTPSLFPGPVGDQDLPFSLLSASQSPRRLEWWRLGGGGRKRGCRRFPVAFLGLAGVQASENFHLICCRDKGSL